jgi:hypothetical protein
VRFRRVVRGKPVGTAEAGLVAGNIENVLEPEAQPGKRSRRRAWHFDMGVAAEGTEWIPIEHAHKNILKNQKFMFT